MNINLMWFTLSNPTEACESRQNRRQIVFNRVCSRAKTTSTTYKSNLKDKIEIKSGKTTMQLLGWTDTKNDWTTAEKVNKITAVSIKEIRKQENMKNASNQSKFTTEEKSTVTINQGNSKRRELQRT